MKSETPTVVLVDSGGANISSVRFALARLGIAAAMTADPGRIRAADRVILPGVGAADAGMKRLHELGLVEVLRGLDAPIAGVCLGMQLLHEASTEGAGGRATPHAPTECLGLLPGVVEEMKPAPGVRIPHMGWNVLRPGPAIQSEISGEPGQDRVAALVRSADPRAYFVHSWAAPVTQDTIAITEHGQQFAAVVRRGAVWGMQFHPERSGRLGAAMLAAFCGVELPQGEAL